MSAIQTSCSPDYEIILSGNKQTVQCNHCEYHFDAEKARKSRRSIQSYFRKHMQSVHSKVVPPPATKKQKSSDESMEIDSEKATGASNEFEDFSFSGGDNNFHANENDGSIASFDVTSAELSDDDNDNDGESIASFDFTEDGSAEMSDDDNDNDGEVLVSMHNESCLYTTTVEEANSMKRTYCYDDFLFLRPDGANYVNNNQLYFYEKANARVEDPNDHTGGMRSLSYRSLAGRKGDTTKLAPYQTAKLLYRLNAVLLNTSKGPKQNAVMDLVDDLCGAMQSTVNDVFKDESVPVVPEWLPRNFSNARRVLLEGPNCLMVNFPAPKVSIINGVAYVQSLKQVIQMMAGHKGGFQFMWDADKGQPNTDMLNGTKAAAICANNIRATMEREAKEQGEGSEDILQKTHMGWVTFWSDSFLKSFVKQKNNSVWLHCATISPPPSEISKGTYTVVLAMGKSGQDHSPVVEHFYNEIRDLRKGFDCYFGDDNTIKTVAYDLLYHSCDRPERDHNLETLAEGTYGKVTGYAVEISRTKLPACIDCYKALIKHLIGGCIGAFLKPSCSKCFCWDIDPDDAVQKEGVMPAKENYPSVTELCESNGTVIDPPKGREPGRQLLGPIRLSSEWMIRACKYAYEARRIRRWNSAEFHEYLRSCSVNKQRATLIEKLALEDGLQQKRSEYRDYVPRLWSMDDDCFQRRKFPDMPMHALAHGQGGDVIEFNHNILTSFERGAAFTKYVNVTLSDIAGFRLDWCKPKTYPKSAWVGENIMAFLRLCSYLYGMYLLNHPLGKEHESLVDSMKKMLNAYQLMLSSLMSTKQLCPQLIRNKVKLFMSTAHFCDQEAGLNQSIQKKQKKLSPVDILSSEEVLVMLYSLNVTSSSESDPRRAFNKLTAKYLIRHLKQRNLKTTGNKTDLQIRLMNFILDRPISMPRTNDSSGDNSPGDGHSVPSKSCVWDKGAWLSFVTNIAEQIELLGPLVWIW